MATVVDTLVLALEIDAKPLMRSLAEIGESVAKYKDKFAKHAQEMEYASIGLARALGGVAGGLLGVAAAATAATLALVKFAQDHAPAITQFGAIAQAAGMGIEQLSAWGQAAKAVGGNADELADSFVKMQQALQKWQGPGPGRTGEVSPEFLRAWQSLRLGDPAQYLDKTTGTFNIDEIAKRIAANTQGMSISQRNLLLDWLGLKGGGIGELGLFAQGRAKLEEQLKFQLKEVGVLTDAQYKKFRELNEAMVNFQSAIEALGRTLAMWVVEPLKATYEWLTKTLSRLNEFIPNIPGWLKDRLFGSSAAAAPATTAPLLPGHPQSQRPPIPLAPPTLGGEPAPPAAAPAGPSLGGQPVPPPGSLGPGAKPPGAAGAPSVIGPPPGFGGPSPAPQTAPSAPPSGPSVPSIPFSPPQISPSPSGGFLLPGQRLGPSLGGQSLPVSPSIVPATPTVPPFSPQNYINEQFQQLQQLPPSSPRSYLDQQFLQMPQYATAATANVQRASTTNNISNTIGSMTFNSRASDTQMGHAPASIEKSLSVGEYAVHANDALQ